MLIGLLEEVSRVGEVGCMTKRIYDEASAGPEHMRIEHGWRVGSEVGMEHLSLWAKSRRWGRVISSVQFSHSVVSDSLWPHGLQHARPPCPSPIPRVHSNSWPLSRWCHPTTSSYVIPSSSCLQSFPASGSFQTSQFFASGGQRIGVSASASVLLMNIQDWFPLGWTGWISLQSKGLSSVFSNTTVQKHQFFGAQDKSYANLFLDND